MTDPLQPCDVDDLPVVSRGQSEFDIRVELFALGWTRALARGDSGIGVSSAALLDQPKTFAVRFGKPQLRTSGYAFPAVGPPEKLPGISARECSATTSAHESADGGRAESASSGSPARLRPPRDVVKLADRLYYVLQPPLDIWFKSHALEFPHNPFPYQLSGMAFLYPRVAAILADEMGLGKTMQAISSIRLLLRCGEARNILLVCPKPLVTNWQREFAMWAPEIPVSVVKGNQQTRHWQWRNNAAPVRIANYELMVRDQQVVSREAGEFDLIVLDEAQRIKNRLSATSQAVRELPRRRSWALTGTPVENSAEDLMGIFEFLAPGLLSRAMTPRRMGKSVNDYILRRTKEQVLDDLPPKLFRAAEIDLSPEQRAAYDLAESAGVVRLTEMGQSITVQHIFELVLRLKQICNFDPRTGASSKLERLEADLEEIAASGQKAIVFSQWVRTLRYLKDKLGRFGPLEYHGQIPATRRDGIIEQFKNDPRAHVVLMSYGCGSVGLNLQFAGYVFLFDRWWNPAVEDQAINRAHRIGSTGPVTVTRFLALSTIEERIDQVLNEKRALFDTILSHAHGNVSNGLSQKELFSLFNLTVAGADGRDAA